MGESLRLIIEMDRAREPIHGTVADRYGHVREYVGWLALISALEELRRTPVEEEPCPVLPSS